MLYAIFFILLIMVGDVYDGSFVGHYPSVGKNKLTSNDTSIYNSDSLRADMNSNHLSFLHILNKRSEIIAEPVSDDIKGGTFIGGTFLTVNVLFWHIWEIVFG